MWKVIREMARRKCTIGRVLQCLTILLYSSLSFADQVPVTLEESKAYLFRALRNLNSIERCHMWGVWRQDTRTGDELRLHWQYSEKSPAIIYSIDSDDISYLTVERTAVDRFVIRLRTVARDREKLVINEIRLFGKGRESEGFYFYDRLDLYSGYGKDVNQEVELLTSCPVKKD
jgi:hypothetical protein